MFSLIRSVDWSLLEAIRSIRTPFFNLFFLFWNLFDRQEFFIVLISGIWLFVCRKWAIRLFLLSALSRILNLLFKDLFFLPRPFFDDPTFPLLFIAGSGFPSGAAQTSVFLPGFLLSVKRTPLFWIFGGLFGLFLSFSRLYLGVHYPSDLIGGWIVGAGILLFWIYGWHHLEMPFLALAVRKRFALAQGVLFILSFLLSGYPISMLLGAASGMSLGDFLLEEQFWYEPVLSRAKHALIGFAGMGVSVLLFAPFHAWTWMAMFWGVWLSIGTPFTVLSILPYLRRRQWLR